VRPITTVELVINLEEVSVRALINESSPMCRGTPSADAGGLRTKDCPGAADTDACRRP